ncbi:MAG: nicotinate-nucleotide adenylyltransferase [Pseudomonadota bacterium]
MYCLRKWAGTNLTAQIQKNGPKNEGKAITRIGLFGGTFNPIHLGHLQAAKMVMERLSLTSLLFIPAAVPPHKALTGVVGAADRLEMIRLAISDQPGFSVSDVEINRAGPSYTIDTVTHFQSGAAGGEQYYLIVGLDAFLEIDTWNSYKTLMKTIPLVVLARPEIGHEENGDGAVRERILQFLRKKISPDYVFSVASDCFHCADYQPLTVLSGGLRALCATFIRERIHAGADIDTLVPALVGTFIRRKGLYR